MPAPRASIPLVFAAMAVMTTPPTPYGFRQPLWLADQPAGQATPTAPETTGTTTQPAGDAAAAAKKKEEPACVTVPQHDPSCPGSQKRFVKTCKPNNKQTYLKCL